jgi:hypothetical protein
MIYWTEETHSFLFEKRKAQKNNPNGVYETTARSRCDHEPIITRTVQNKPGKSYAILKGQGYGARGNANLVLPTNAMKSPLNASSAPPAPRDMDTATAGQLSELYSHITALNRQYLFPKILMLT